MGLKAMSSAWTHAGLEDIRQRGSRLAHRVSQAQDRLQVGDTDLESRGTVYLMRCKSINVGWLQNPGIWNNIQNGERTRTRMGEELR